MVSAAAAIFLYVFGERLITTVMGADYALAGQLIAPAMAIVAAQLFPVGFLQLTVLRERYAPGILGGACGCLVVTIGFAVAASSLTPGLAIQIVALAWIARVLVILAFGRNVPPMEKSGTL